MVRPPGATPRLWHKFLSLFNDGCQFWTSQDGNAMDFVIVQRPNALKVLRENFISHDFTKASLKYGWVDYQWAEREFFDDPYEHAARRGKTWQLSETETPFPVLYWNPYP